MGVGQVRRARTARLRALARQYGVSDELATMREALDYVGKLVQMKALYPSFAPPEKWRDGGGKSGYNAGWKALRQRILERDSFSCAYCGYASEKYQIVDHIDGNPDNNKEGNLQVVCQMCNLIKHAGRGCVIVGVVDLYRKSKYAQNEIMRLTHEMRDAGASDARIIRHLGLEWKAGWFEGTAAGNGQG